ncbi:uncharacterized protein LOC107825130 [Nicotiana tabacum]|uniref:Uncharacterized protein LOC107825130 n=1 Tax=Nicotiana tabacum TaxID=4097 RepID=A0AC58RVS4_TOBAC
METICIIVTFNGRWTEDYKYLDHQTKLVLVPEAILFEDFIKHIFEVIELDRDKFEAVIWFDINLGTSNGMLVSKDLDLHTCIELLKAHSLFKGCRFIVDISERVFGSTSTFEHVNRETQHDNQNKCQQIIIKDSILFKIVKIEKNYDCSVSTMKADQRHATSKLISGYIINNLRDPRFEVTPAFVMAKMQKLHGLDIGYHKAWHAIQRASALIRGTPEENYELLSSYLYMMRSKNPETYTNTKIDDDNRFLYMFYTYGSSISGWNHCRTEIVVDATFLKSKFRDVLMISVSKDANNQIFSLAFGIAESENNNSYEWYFSELRTAIGSPEPKAKESEKRGHKIFQSAARVYMRKEFDLYMSDIAKVDKKTYDYLMEEPPKKWARSCSPRRRYDMLTTNIVESMNSVLLELRKLHILRMMDFIQVKLQRWFYERTNEAEGTFYDVSCWVEEELKKKIDLAFTLNLSRRETSPTFACTGT